MRSAAHDIAWRATSLVLRAIFLPLNYFLELGFFFYIAWIQWRPIGPGQRCRGGNGPPC